MEIVSIFQFIILFLALCVIIIIGLVSWNIFSKSYKFQNALIVLVPIWLILIICGFFVTINIIDLGNRFDTIEASPSVNF
jgi:hypothetical protein